MHIVRLKISGFRGVSSADITLGRHAVLVGPNNSGKTTIIEALALLFGRDRLVRRLTEHDFHGSAPDEAARILCIATVTGFTPNDPHHHSSWFSPERGVEKWYDPNAKTLSATPDAHHTDLAVQIGFAARFDLDELEAETIRFFVDDEATLGDPFAEDAHLRTIHTKILQELGFFLVPASRTWDRWISFSSELFRRVVATRGDMPAQAVRAERARLWTPPEGTRLEDQPGLSEIVGAANDELRALMASAPRLQLRLTSTDSDSVLESVVPHFAHGTGPTLPSQRQGTGLVSLQSLLLLMQFGKARAETGQSFVLAVEEPELHIQPSQQKRLVNRLNALCNQTIVTTHSPIVAAMFPAPDTLFIETRGGVLNAKPLMDPVPAQPTNHQQHLLFAWRQKLVAALMHECVLIPEGVSDVAWLEALQTALELHQGWQDAGDGAPLLATFVGVVPTIDAKIADTFALVCAVHARPCILVDGDNEGGRRVTESDSSHGVSDAFLDHLDQLARQDGGSWWQDVLKRDDIFLAVRRNSLNAYYRGGSIFRIDDRGDGTPSPKTHVKYLVRQQQALAELVDGEFRPNAIGWTHYAGQETLKDMIRSASDLAGAEKTGLHPLIMGSPAVIDVEIALDRVQVSEINGSTADDTASPARRNLDRLDVATLERQGTDIAVVFHEAKHFTNTALRARSGAPAVVGQLSRYRSTLNYHTPALIARYQATCRAILRLGAMRRHVHSDSGPGSSIPCDPMVQEVATGNAVLTIDPNPRLIVFGFDADQKKGQLQVILSALKTADPNLAVYAAGDPASAGGAFRPPAKP